MSSTSDTLGAADPAGNASVHASAGTGKTWLLVTRIIRLLLRDAAPDSILAITFTRKAAAEMQQRVTERLRTMMAAEPMQLDDLLLQCGIKPDDAVRTRARRLYEDTLHNPYALRATTFHAFCQELLQRFPLEAGVAPGFELTETTGLLEQSAMDALVAETARDPDGALATELARLVEGCDGLDNARSALNSFLAHRSDWWAFIENHADASAHASGCLTRLLDIEPDEDPLQGFPEASLRERLHTFAGLLEKNKTKTNLDHAGTINKALNDALPAADIMSEVSRVIFTGSGSPRVYKASPTQRKRLGEAGERQFLELHAALVAELGELHDRQARFRTLQTNLAWYFAGMRLLQQYQRIKQEQRLLDFPDLEWQACRLLNRSDHASWVQYKLDARIDHLLIDEFQDTNPTQWRLLLPLLKELAAGDSGRNRSVFLVGDRKQSIYGFRRANPALLNAASDWLSENLQAKKYPLDASRRSAQAIIDTVNMVFSEEPLRQHISEFNLHSTHHQSLYGRVEILPLVHKDLQDTESPATTTLRNPLESPRCIDAEPLHYREGKRIAEQIVNLISAGTRVVRDDIVSTLDYGDIIILLRRRTHAGEYERALREADIPYTGAGRRELLDNLEVRDLEALLKLLISPYANLELAQVLRSPLFGLVSEQLLPLAGKDGRCWYERLAALAESGQSPYLEAHAMLEGWRAHTGKLPVHDLLDRIYYEGDVAQRYRAAFPPQLHSRVEASLTRFIELALELDNGRYPSLPHFLDRLMRLRQSAQDQPDEGTPDDVHGKRVRLLTIHGAKGLEAPVIFLADTANNPQDRSANETLVAWPAGKTAPEHFLLIAKKDLQDTASQALLEKRRQERQREDANLLYVAMTRARQYLYLSGSVGKPGAEPHWYSMIRTAVSAWATNHAGHLYHESGQIPDAPKLIPARVPTMNVDPRLAKRLPPSQFNRVQITPSTMPVNVDVQGGDADGRERGIALHAMLEWLAETGAGASDEVPEQLANRLERAAQNPQLLAWWKEAQRTVCDPALEHLFDSRQYVSAMNEVPVQYIDAGRQVYGIIDRVVIREDVVLVIDYKTHRLTDLAQLPILAEHYREQMRLYAQAAARLWPHRRIDAQLLFTASGTLVPIVETAAGD